MKSLIAIAVSMAAWLVLPGIASAQKSAAEQCSLALVSHVALGRQNVCDGEIVREMARRGHVFEQNQMGIASMLAIGPDYSDQDALLWFQRAALRGYAPAQVNLAVMYMNGWTTAVNYGAALHWFHEAAAQGFPRAYYNLGILFLNGWGVAQDYKEAFYWFERGAKASDSSAETNLGYLYDQGFGCDHNPGAAVTWYRKAADAGNPMAEHNLGDMYLHGDGVAPNDAEAFRWFQKASAGGSAAARVKLGYMYSGGLGVAKDPETAYMWTLSAALAGDHRGDDLKSQLEGRLTPPQIAEARERALAMSEQSQPQTARNSFVP